MAGDSPLLGRLVVGAVGVVVMLIGVGTGALVVTNPGATGTSAMVGAVVFAVGGLGLAVLAVLDPEWFDISATSTTMTDAEEREATFEAEERIEDAGGDDEL